jgi:hypothetical protein
MADLRRQMKSQEENNAKYVERIVRMDEEVRKQVTLKTQIEMYKKQIQELHERVTSDEARMKFEENSEYLSEFCYFKIEPITKLGGGGQTIYE